MHSRTCVSNGVQRSTTGRHLIPRAAHLRIRCFSNSLGASGQQVRDVTCKLLPTEQRLHEALTTRILGRHAFPVELTMLSSASNLP